MSSGAHRLNVGYETNEQHRVINCDRGENTAVRIRLATKERE